MSSRTAYRICPFCEATCGLELQIEDDAVVSVRGDQDDAFSEGYLCPKGVALKALHEDPDRLRTPMIREGETWRAAGWDEAFALIDTKLRAVVDAHGKDAVGVYLGNPTVHNAALVLYAPAFIKALGTRNIFSASSVDQLPKQLACALMFGTGLSIPIPDIDRTDYLMVLGANPLVSNGSLLTAPNIGERLKRIQQRGGKMVVIDPRRSETAKAADEHHGILPGTDALFLLGIVHTLFEEGLVSPGRLEEHAEGIDEIRELASGFAPETVAAKCGIDAATIRRLAREIAAAPSAAVYGRIGTCTQAFGTLANWLPEVIHYLTGNLDRPGGAMFTLPAYGPGNTKGEAGKGRGARVRRRSSRVSGLGEVFGEFPVACMAEEIETPGEGQIRALFTIAGNPLLSTPNAGRLRDAVESLDFMVSLDIYLNETSRCADVILPGLSPLEGCHYDLAFSQLAIQNHARFSPAVFEKAADALDEWETLLRLAGIAAGMGADADVSFLDNMVIGQLVQREVGMATSPIHGRDTEEIIAALAPRVGPERVIDFMLRTGPQGEGFGADAEGLSLTKLEAHPHGIDLGPLGARIPEVLRTASGKIELAPELITADVARLTAYLESRNGGMVLVGRRHLRSNNSWMHNLPNLVSGKPRCTLHVAPEDATRLGLADGAMARVTSKAGSVEIVVETTADIRAGVVSIPHGWGHDAPGAQLGVARAHAGVNTNILTDEHAMDEPSGNAVLCGIPVEIAAAN